MDAAEDPPTDEHDPVPAPQPKSPQGPPTSHIHVEADIPGNPSSAELNAELEQLALLTDDQLVQLLAMEVFAAEGTTESDE